MDEEPGFILCDKHGYFWWEDGCPGCAQEAEEESTYGNPADDPDEIDWLNPARHPYGRPWQVAPPACDIVNGMCLTHQRPSWQCDEQP